MVRITKKNISFLFSIKLEELEHFIKENNIKAFRSAGFMYYNLMEMFEKTNFIEKFIINNEYKDLYDDIIFSNKINTKESKLIYSILLSYLKSQPEQLYSKFKEIEYKKLIDKKNKELENKKNKSILKKEIKQAYSKNILKSNNNFKQNSHNSFYNYELKNAKYILHIGETNSGKTYNALQDLKNNGGVYLAPLRLLAWEVFDKFIKENISCSLITGEEQIINENDFIVSSTIEMFNYEKKYKTVLVDECFMLSDKDRGKSWLKVITSAKADVIHLICNKESEFIITKILTSIGRNNFEIKRYKRLVPLEVKKIKQSKPPKKTVLIAFSRISVLKYKVFYEQKGYNVSVLYGNLPPEVKRNEIEKFITGKTDICISTDVIGMGLNLPCDNIIFLELSKFDGIYKRELNSTEIKQISGRAGRFGLSEMGFVSSQNNDFILKKLNEFNIIELVYLGFDYKLFLNIKHSTMIECIELWNKSDFIPSELKNVIKKECVQKYLKLINQKVEDIEKIEPEIAWNLIYSPVKENNKDIYYNFVDAIHSGNKYKFIYINSFEIKDVVRLKIIEDNLSKIDLFLYFYNNKFFKKHLDVSEEEILNLKKNRNKMIDDITIFLLDKKLGKNKFCEECGVNVGINWEHKLCNSCFINDRNFYYDYF